MSGRLLFLYTLFLSDWVRELEKWGEHLAFFVIDVSLVPFSERILTVTSRVLFVCLVPHIRVVPYHGQKESREVIEKYELFHAGTRAKKGLKA